jgi:hypothetical protein
MATGYTYKIENGEMTSLREYALLCARAFGPFIHQRDEGLDAPLRLPEPETHAQRRLVEVTGEREALRARSDAEWRVVIEGAYLDACKYYEGAVARYQERVDRYSAMREKVQDWVASEKLLGLKRFMLTQLSESMRFDCTEPEPPKRFGLDEYKRIMLEGADRSVAMYTEDAEKEIKGNAFVKAWIIDLMTGIPEDK